MTTTQGSVILALTVTERPLKQKENIMSATNRPNKSGPKTVRDPKDFYATPHWVINELAKLIAWQDIRSFHEPCIGTGNIYHAIPLEESKKSWHELTMGKDYLKDDLGIVDLVITNPPFTQAEDFIKRARSHSHCTIMLLPLNFLASVKRNAFWKTYAPDQLIILSSRPSFTEDGKTDHVDYAWYVWGGKDVLKTTAAIQWLVKPDSRYVVKLGLTN